MSTIFPPIKRRASALKKIISISTKHIPSGRDAQHSVSECHWDRLLEGIQPVNSGENDPNK